MQVQRCNQLVNSIIILSFTRHFNSKVPKLPHKPHCKSNTIKEAKAVKIDTATITHLETLSLVNFGDLKGIQILESAIQFAEPLFSRETIGIKPLTSVLEDRVLALRDDEVADGNCRDIVMANAKVTEEEYFVAPPGNIPVELQSYDNNKEDRQKIAH